jgi:hypothetical protein
MTLGTTTDLLRFRLPAGRLALLVAGACLALSSLGAGADVTAGDLQIVARTLGFLERPLTGELNMGIVHDSRNPNSRRQAELIADMLNRGPRVGGLQLKPVLVTVGEAADARVDLFMMTEFLGDAAASFPAVLDHRQIPCITTDMQQVRDGICVIGVQSAPKVEIRVNSETASRTGTRFSTAFRMLIKEF